jgi:hypothetical protein
MTEVGGEIYMSPLRTTNALFVIDVLIVSTGADG